MAENRTKAYYLVRKIAVLGMLSAVSIVLQIMEFPVPFLIPPFVKMDFSDLPVLLTSFAYGPLSGVTVCLIKNLIHMTATQSAFIGELANFILGTIFAVIAGIVYKVKKSRKGAVWASVAASLVMGLSSVPVNLYVTYPFYISFYGMPLETIIAMYRVILPTVDGLLPCLLVFNLPFTVLKGLLCAFLAFFIYKPLSPIFHGTEKRRVASL